jgi:Na+-transporting methylmalonyl-CoA/oxaloacetate decarboxylase gamma subunit
MEALRIRGLRQRWIVNTIMPVLVLLVLIVTLFSAGVSSYYYSSVRDGLEKQAQAMAGAFNDYFMTGYTEYYQMAVQTTDSFEDKDRIELQFIDSSGSVQTSTSGLKAGTFPGTSDIRQAIQDGEMRHFQGRDPETGENILAVSYPLLFNGKVVGVMRLVTSLRAVNRQIIMAVLAILAIAVICMALVVISNLCSSTTWWSRWRWSPMPPSAFRRAATASASRTSIRMSWGNWWTTSTTCR